LKPKELPSAQPGAKKIRIRLKAFFDYKLIDQSAAEIVDTSPSAPVRLKAPAVADLHEAF
jgi:ribosomal protein S10